MCRGQGGLALTGPDLAAQIEYQGSVQLKRPFVALTAVKGAEIEGEVTPDSSVEIVSGSGRDRAEVQGHTWRAKVPKGSWVIEVVSEGARTMLDPKKQPFK